MSGRVLCMEMDAEGQADQEPREVTAPLGDRTAFSWHHRCPDTPACTAPLRLIKTATADLAGGRQPNLHHEIAPRV